MVGSAAAGLRVHGQYALHIYFDRLYDLPLDSEVLDGGCRQMAFPQSRDVDGLLNTVSNEEQLGAPSI